MSEFSLSGTDSTVGTIHHDGDLEDLMLVAGQGAIDRAADEYIEEGNELPEPMRMVVAVSVSFTEAPDEAMIPEEEDYEWVDAKMLEDQPEDDDDD